MNIYAKLASIQKKIMSMKIPKSGYNKHRDFHYHELEDLLPPIFEACFEEELTLMFNFTEDAAVLHLKSWNANTEVAPLDEIRVRAPFPEVVPNKGTSIIQTEGAYITYLKRYLLTNLFLIIENDIIDSSGECECEECDCKEKTSANKSKKASVKKGAKKSKAKSKSGEKPDKLKNAINLAKNNGGVTADNVCYQADMLLKKGVVSKDQSEAIKTYVHEHGVEV